MVCVVECVVECVDDILVECVLVCVVEVDWLVAYPACRGRTLPSVPAKQDERAKARESFAERAIMYEVGSSRSMKSTFNCKERLCSYSYFYPQWRRSGA